MFLLWGRCAINSDSRLGFYLRGLESLAGLATFLADRHEHKVAVRVDRDQLTFGDLERYSISVANWMIDRLAIAPGTRIIIHLPNSVHYPIALMAAWRTGMIPVCLSPSSGIEEIDRAAKSSGASVIITEAKSPVLLDLSRRRKKSLQTISCSEEDFSYWFLRPIKRFFRHMKTPRRRLAEFKFRDGLDYRALNARIIAQTPGDDVALVQSTSGTTGTPKGVKLSHGNLLANIRQLSVSLQVMGLEGRQRLLQPLPIYHSYPMMMCLTTWAQGGSVELVSDVKDINQIAELFDRVRPTLFAGISPVFFGLMQHPLFSQLDFSALKCTLSGGAPLKQFIADRWQSITGNVISQGYGLTECSPVVTLDTSGQFHDGIVGTPLPLTEIEIRDDDGNSLPVGSAGQIYVRGPQVMSGYCNYVYDTADISLDGWLATGDIGRFEEQGTLRMIERQTDVIHIGGFKVYPSAIEALVAEHPDILDVAVSAYEEDGETKLRLYAVTNNRRLTQKMIREYCRQRLTSYKVPERIELRQSLPHTPVGKVLRHELSEA